MKFMLQAMLMWLVARLSPRKPEFIPPPIRIEFFGGQRGIRDGFSKSFGSHPSVSFYLFCRHFFICIQILQEGQSKPGVFLKAALFSLEISQNCIAKDMGIVSISKRLMCTLNDVRCSFAVIV